MSNLIIPIVAVILFLLSAIRILNEYERAVIFTLGRFTRVAGPGLIVVIPFIQTIVRVDMRVIVMDIPPQDVISKDNISVKVNAVLYFKVIQADKAIINVEESFSYQSIGSNNITLCFRSTRIRRHAIGTRKTQQSYSKNN